MKFGEQMTADLSTSLRFGRDDKREDRYGPKLRFGERTTADLSTALGFGRDDKGRFGEGKPQVLQCTPRAGILAGLTNSGPKVCCHRTGFSWRSSYVCCHPVGQ